MARDGADTRSSAAAARSTPGAPAPRTPPTPRCPTCTAPPCSVRNRSSNARARRPGPPGKRPPARPAPGCWNPDVTFDRTADKVVVADFPVSGAAPRGGVTTEPDWERAMSIIAGTPTATPRRDPRILRLRRPGRLNFALRQKRADAALALLPPATKKKIITTQAEFCSSSYWNHTAQQRARNRAVLIHIFAPLGPNRSDACDMLTAAADLDQFIFMVRCMEKRLGRTTSGDAPVVLSLLRADLLRVGQMDPGVGTQRGLGRRGDRAAVVAGHRSVTQARQEAVRGAGEEPDDHAKRQDDRPRAPADRDGRGPQARRRHRARRPARARHFRAEPRVGHLGRRLRAQAAAMSVCARSSRHSRGQRRALLHRRCLRRGPRRRHRCLRDVGRDHAPRTSRSGST